jgi:hypothetical protein
MTTPARDEFPPRDPRFDAAWRASSGENPPASLDAAIRAAARREVGAGPQSASAQAATQARRRWWPLAAAATVAAIAVGVVQLATHEELGVPSADNAVVSDMPAQRAKPAESASERKAAAAPASIAVPPPPTTTAPVTSAPVPVAPAPAPAPPAPAKPVPREQAAASGGGGAADARVSAPAPMSATPMQKKSESPPAIAEPFPASPAKLGTTAAADAPSPDIAPQRREAAGAVSADAQRSAPPPAAALASSPRMDAARPAPVAKTAMVETQQDAAARIKDRPPLPVADWIALIRRLRDEGNVSAAAAELAAFRAAHADHEKLLPPDLRDWRPPQK